jgi:hypothetical protein
MASSQIAAYDLWNLAIDAAGSTGLKLAQLTCRFCKNCDLRLFFGPNRPVFFKQALVKLGPWNRRFLSFRHP